MYPWPQYSRASIKPSSWRCGCQIPIFPITAPGPGVGERVAGGDGRLADGVGPDAGEVTSMAKSNVPLRGEAIAKAR